MLAPIWIVGSNWDSKKHIETMEVVVVFPCVPETQMVFLNALVISPKISFLSNVGISKSVALTNSGSSLLIAAE